MTVLSILLVTVRGNRIGPNRLRAAVLFVYEFRLHNKVTIATAHDGVSLAG